MSLIMGHLRGCNMQIYLLISNRVFVLQLQLKYDQRVNFLFFVCLSFPLPSPLLWNILQSCKPTKHTLGNAGLDSV
jgi:hypothetical protein